MSTSRFTLKELPNEYAISKFPLEAEIPLTRNLNKQPFVSISRSDTELSVICPRQHLPVCQHKPLAVSENWRCLKVLFDSEPNEVPGVVSSLVTPLSNAGLSVFVVSTFDTDHLLVDQLESACSALETAGHIIERFGKSNTQAQSVSAINLETERLKLRHFQEDDFEKVAGFFGDSKSSLYGGPCDRDTAWRKFAAWYGHWAIRGYGPFAIEQKNNKEFIGWTGPWYPEGWPEPEITWALLPEAQGQGFATEAARCALDYAYSQLHWSTAISVIDDRNTASIALASRLGAKVESSLQLFGHSAKLYRHEPYNP